MLIALDVLSKAAALKWIAPLQGMRYPFGGIGIFENFCSVSFSLNTVANTGIAWGLFPGHEWILLGIRVAIAAGLFAYLFRSRPEGIFGAALWLIAAGAIGNILDMCCYGSVVDFFHVRFAGWSFPIFNLADSYISIGAALLLIAPKPETRSVSAEADVR